MDDQITIEVNGVSLTLVPVRDIKELRAKNLVILKYSENNKFSIYYAEGECPVGQSVDSSALLNTECPGYFLAQVKASDDREVELTVNGLTIGTLFRHVSGEVAYNPYESLGGLQ